MKLPHVCVTARTNYLKVKDLRGLKTNIERFGFNLEQSPSTPDMFKVVSYKIGGWNSILQIFDKQTSKSTSEFFSFEKHVLPFIIDKAVLITKEEAGDYYVTYRFKDGALCSTMFDQDDVFNLVATATLNL